MAPVAIRCLLAWLVGMAAALWLAPACAAAQDPVRLVAHMDPVRLVAHMDRVPLAGQSRFWFDPARSLSAEQVEASGEQLPWRPQLPGLQHRLDGGALWLRFDVLAASPGRWFLELGSSGLDRVQLFYRAPAGQWVVQEAGDTQPVSGWPVPGRVPTFELSAPPGRVVTHWLRVEHARVDFAAPAVVYDQGSLLASREREQFALGAYFGLAALITAIAIANAGVHRDPAFFAYAVYVALFALGQAAYLGVGAQHLWPRWLAWNEMATFLLPGLGSAAGLWFVKTVTEPARFSRGLDMAVRGLILALVGAVALDTVVASRPTFALVMTCTALSLLLVVALIAVVWRTGDDPDIRIIALGFVPVIVMALFPVARGLNLVPNSALTRYGLAIGGALEMPILFYALGLRGSRRREAQLRAVALDRHDALTGLSHGLMLLQRLQASLQRARGQRHNAALLAVNLVNGQAIAEQFGQDTLDRALVVTASHLRRASTHIDLAARVGDLRFAVLIDGPTSSVLAMSRAQQVVADGLREVEALPPGLTLRYHIAVAMLPQPDLDAQASLDFALRAVEAMPPDARKAIRLLPADPAIPLQAPSRTSA